MSDLETVRDWVGDEPDDTAVNAQLARFADESDPAPRAALSILLRREADWGASKWAVSGDYSEETTEQYRSLQAKIARLRAICGDTVSVLPPLEVGHIAGPGNLR